MGTFGVGLAVVVEEEVVEVEEMSLSLSDSSFLPSVWVSEDVYI